MGYPEIAYGTPRKLPKAKELSGRVVVLDIAFAAETGGASFEKVTGKLIDGLGDRLAMWIDHHDHARHVEYADDPRFVLSTKAEHPACPEMVTEERPPSSTRKVTLFPYTTHFRSWASRAPAPLPSTGRSAASRATTG